MEQRTLQTEVRVKTVDGKKKIIGLISYNQPAAIWGITEFLRPGACRNLSDDIKSCFNHDASMPLASSLTKTLKLSI